MEATTSGESWKKEQLALSRRVGWGTGCRAAELLRTCKVGVADRKQNPEDELGKGGGGAWPIRALPAA